MFLSPVLVGCDVVFTVVVSFVVVLSGVVVITAVVEDTVVVPVVPAVVAALVVWEVVETVVVDSEVVPSVQRNIVQTNSIWNQSDCFYHFLKTPFVVLLPFPLSAFLFQPKEMYFKSG